MTKDTFSSLLDEYLDLRETHKLGYSHSMSRNLELAHHNQNRLIELRYSMDFLIRQGIDAIAPIQTN
jgi:hypothetical protein